MSAHDEAVEAAAQAICQDVERSGGPPWDLYPEKERSGRIAKETFRNQARDAITAYLRHLRAAGFVVTRVPEPERYEKGSGASSAGVVVGWNACRAEMLLHAVEPPHGP